MFLASHDTLTSEAAMTSEVALLSEAVLTSEAVVISESGSTSGDALTQHYVTDPDCTWFSVPGAMWNPVWRMMGMSRWCRRATFSPSEPSS